MQHVLEYSRAVLNYKARLQRMKMAGISDDLLTKLKEFSMSYLQYTKEDVNKVRFIKSMKTKLLTFQLFHVAD